MWKHMSLFLDWRCNSMISLDEMKNYLRIDFDDDDTLLENLIVSSERLCMDIARIKSKAVFEKKETAKIAVMYAVAVFTGNRQNAKNQKLTEILADLSVQCSRYE